jgi:hypothetical protein
VQWLCCANHLSNGQDSAAFAIVLGYDTPHEAGRHRTNHRSTHTLSRQRSKPKSGGQDGQTAATADARGDDHFCPYRISGAGADRILYGAGVDAFQAIELGLRMIGVDLAALNRKLDDQLRWECDEHGGLGFPIA